MVTRWIKLDKILGRGGGLGVHFCNLTVFSMHNELTFDMLYIITGQVPVLFSDGGFRTI